MEETYWMVGQNLTKGYDGPWRPVGFIFGVDDARRACVDSYYFMFPIDAEMLKLNLPICISELPPVHYPKALPLESGEC